MPAPMVEDPVRKRFRTILDEVYGDREMDRIIPIVTDILYVDEAFIHAMPYAAGAYPERTPLMGEIRREGMDL